MKKVVISWVHGNNKVSSWFQRQISVWANDYTDQKATFRELLEFFTNAHGPGYDADTIAILSNTKTFAVCPKYGHMRPDVRFQWSYSIPKHTWAPIEFYVSEDALSTFKFWYPDNTLPNRL